MTFRKLDREAGDPPIEFLFIFIVQGGVALGILQEDHLPHTTILVQSSFAGGFAEVRGSPHTRNYDG
jgi:hypothetical protein